MPAFVTASRRAPSRARIDAAGAVPDDARPQLGELVGRVAPGEHVEHVLELRAREVAERIGARDERVQVVDADLLVDRDRDDLLREHVERVARDLRLLDLALAHRARDDRGLEQVGAELREDAALRDGAELVAGAADALQAARDRLRRLDLDHEVDRAHVDARARGSRSRRGTGSAPPSGPPRRARAARARASRGARARDPPSLGELVQPQREPLGEPAVVDEDDRRAVRLDEPQDLGIDRRPDRAARRARCRCPSPGRRPGPGARATRSSRARACPRPGRRPRGRAPCACRRRRASIGRPPETNRPISSSGRCVADRPMRWNGSSTSARAARREIARCAPRLVPATACTSSRISVSTAAQRVARLRGEHQVERLGRRDQDVGRLLEQLAPLLLRRVAGAHRDAQLRLEPGERAAQVALDVVVERLQRRDVEHAQPLRPATRRAGRSRRGTRSASCRSRSAPGSGRARRDAIAGQPSTCGGVGASNAARTRPASQARRQRAGPSR